jgi:hypothetical protein
MYQLIPLADDGEVPKPVATTAAAAANSKPFMAPSDVGINGRISFIAFQQIVYAN